LIDEDEHQAEAVKNDNAAVRTKGWDFFLALGLSDEIREKNGEKRQSGFNHWQ
jgi:hypothetical protein